MLKKKTQEKVKSKVSYCTILHDEASQRIDNFLFTRLKGVPKTHIYRLIRKGEVRVNKKRVTSAYKLVEGDKVRIPPLFLAEKGKTQPPSPQTLRLITDRILYEDDQLLVLNKPSNMSVHAGSTVRMCVIEALKFHYPKLPGLELAHRLDAETSGCLIIAKKKRVLRELHTLFREGMVLKIYWALTQGHWQEKELRADFSLNKHFRHGGKHVVEVSKEGKTSLTLFRPLEKFSTAELVEAKLSTGRTHQIRVHAAHLGHAIAGDERYGDALFNKQTKNQGLKRMFLHAHTIEFLLPSMTQSIRVVAPLDPELEAVLNKFRSEAVKN